MRTTWGRGAAATVVGLVLALAAGSCNGGSGAGDGGAGLDGVTWILDRASVERLVPDAPPDARIDLRVDGEQIGGTAACNSYGGSVTIDGDGFAVGDLAVTEMACEPTELMDLETAFLTALTSVRTSSVDGGELTLGGGDVQLVFAEEPPPAPLPLVGTAWRLESLAYGSDAVSSPVGDEVPTATFDDAGQVGGTTGCNRYGGGYQVEGEAISIGQLRVTLIQCQSAIAQQEDVFQRALQRATTYAIEGDVLTLSDAAGAFLVSFRGDGV